MERDKRLLVLRVLEGPPERQGTVQLQVVWEDWVDLIMLGVGNAGLGLGHGMSRCSL